MGCRRTGESEVLCESLSLELDEWCDLRIGGTAESDFSTIGAGESWLGSIEVALSGVNCADVPV